MPFVLNSIFFCLQYFETITIKMIKKNKAWLDLTTPEDKKYSFLLENKPVYVPNIT